MDSFTINQNEMLQVDRLCERFMTQNEYIFQQHATEPGVLTCFGEDNQENFANNFLMEELRDFGESSTDLYYNIPEMAVCQRAMKRLPYSQDEVIVEDKNSDFFNPSNLIEVLDYHPDAPKKFVEFDRSNALDERMKVVSQGTCLLSNDNDRSKIEQQKAKWKVGDIVQAKFADDQEWYIAEIEEVLCESETIKYKIAWDDGADLDLVKKESEVRDSGFESEEEVAEEEYSPGDFWSDSSSKCTSDNDECFIEDLSDRKITRKRKEKRLNDKPKRTRKDQPQNKKRNGKRPAAEQPKRKKRRKKSPQKKVKHSIKLAENYDELKRQQTKWKVRNVQFVAAQRRFKFLTNLNKERCKIDSQSSLVVAFVMDNKIKELKAQNQSCKYKRAFDEPVMIDAHVQNIPLVVVQIPEFHALSVTQQYVTGNYSSSLIMITEDTEVKTADGSMTTIPKHSFLTGLCGPGETEMRAVSLGIGSQRTSKRNVTKYDTRNGNFIETPYDSFKRIETSTTNYVDTCTQCEAIGIIRQSTGPIKVRFRRFADNVTCGDHNKGKTIKKFYDLLEERLQDQKLVQHINADQMELF